MAARDFTLNGFRDEPTAVPFQPVHFLEQIGGQRDRDAFAVWHVMSVTESMIILKMAVVSLLGRRLALYRWEDTGTQFTAVFEDHGAKNDAGQK